MTVLYRDLSLALDDDEGRLGRQLARKLRIAPDRVRGVEVERRSLDSRGGRPPRFVYTLRVDLDPDVERALLARKNCPVQRYVPPEECAPPPLASRPERRPVVLGSGPAGLFAAWRLTFAGAPPVVLERGPAVKERSLRWFEFTQGGDFDPEANLLFGEGGAGTYSDGKLYTRVHDPRGAEVIRILVAEGGAPGEILTDARPHIGSNRLPAVQRRLRDRLIAEGAEFRFETLATGLVTEGEGDVRRLVGVATRHLPSGEESTLPADALFLAPGHSARDTYGWLRDAAVPMERKPFQIGVRIEHPQAFIDRVQYGRSAGHSALGPADYSWTTEGGGGVDVFSFCMCPGGEILPATERAGLMCTNGASRYKRTSAFANAGLVRTVRPEDFGPGDDPWAGIEFQMEIERAAAAAAGGPFGMPALRIADFIAGRVSDDLPPSSSPLPLAPTDFAAFLPALIREPIRHGLARLAERIPGIDGPEGLVVGPESRSSSPVRVLRDERTFESPAVRGLLPLGEGAGYAGGILSAAIDGMRAAESWLARVGAATR